MNETQYATNIVTRKSRMIKNLTHNSGLPK